MSLLIAVAGRVLKPRPGVPHGDQAAAAPSRYIQALHRAGAHEAILQPVTVDVAEATKRLSRFDGLLLIGGEDLDPSTYGAEPHPKLGETSAPRDSFELPLVIAAIERRMPVLAVCRGIQALNVALGGTLHQHIDEESVNHGGTEDWVSHRVTIEPGSLLYKTLDAETVEPVSRHHQAVADLGEGLKATAWAEDGIVEGVEMDDGWVLGVQWHPELTAAEDPSQQRLFDGFVDAAATSAE
jgi:putative glutamine amidotransferase